MNTQTVEQAVAAASTGNGMSAQTVIVCATGIVALALVLAIVRAVTRQRSSASSISSYSVVDRVKDLGDMVALSAFYKEISTAESGGVPILLTDKRVALISEFEIEWRYDLRRVTSSDSNGIITVTMPPPKPRVNTGEITLHSTESGKLIGLIPVNTFSKDDWNRLVKKARENATASAKEQMKSGLLSRIEKSAQHSMEFLFESAGLPGVRIAFEPAHELEKDLGASVEQAIKDKKVA